MNAVYLFGSYARGDVHPPDTDVDPKQIMKIRNVINAECARRRGRSMISDIIQKLLDRAEESHAAAAEFTQAFKRYIDSLA